MKLTFYQNLPYTPNATVSHRIYSDNGLDTSFKIIEILNASERSHFIVETVLHSKHIVIMNVTDYFEKKNTIKSQGDQRANNICLKIYVYLTFASKFLM